MGATILIVEDDCDCAEVLQDRLQSMGYETTLACDGQEAIESVEHQMPDLVLMDLQMPKCDGMESLRAIRDRWPNLSVIILTGYVTIDVAVEAMKEGAVDFLRKPIETSQLTKAIVKALERQDLKDDTARLLGQMSHDIRNMLMPIMLGTDLLELEIDGLFKRLSAEEMLNAEGSHQVCDEVIDLLQHTTTRIQDQLKGVVDYIRSHTHVPHFVPCDLSELIRDVEMSFRVVAQNSGITLEQEGFASLPTIRADKGRLFSALHNLVNNAVAAVTPGGAIRLKGHQDRLTQSITISVEDTGHGMSPEVLERLFTRQTISRKDSGTGLGTRIVREAIDVHGGTITVSSTEGVGTTFTIRLPAAALYERLPLNEPLVTHASADKGSPNGPTTKAALEVSPSRLSKQSRVTHETGLSEMTKS